MRSTPDRTSRARDGRRASARRETYSSPASLKPWALGLRGRYRVCSFGVAPLGRSVQSVLRGASHALDRVAGNTRRDYAIGHSISQCARTEPLRVTAVGSEPYQIDDLETLPLAVGAVALEERLPVLDSDRLAVRRCYLLLETTFADLIVTGSTGTYLCGPLAAVFTCSIFLTTSIPATTLPNTA